MDNYEKKTIKLYRVNPLANQPTNQLTNQIAIIYFAANNTISTDKIETSYTKDFNWYANCATSLHMI